jgi:hypothetical protein
MTNWSGRGADDEMQALPASAPENVISQDLQVQQEYAYSFL